MEVKKESKITQSVNRAVFAQEDRIVDYSDENIQLINTLAKVPLSRDEVYIRSMWLCNDIIDSYFSRFNEKTLRVIANKMSGVPVLVGHDKSMLPIGRFFKAEVVKREDGHEWVRAWFYWPKNMDHSEDLEKGIASGLYAECSISWAYTKTVCSICGQDIRKCEHVPGKTYIANEEAKLCWYETDGITDVLEASFVYKGGQVGTSIAEEMHPHKEASEERLMFEKFKLLKPAKSASITNEYYDPKQIPEMRGNYFVEPKYDGIRITIHKNGDDIRVFTAGFKEVQGRLPRIRQEMKDIAINDCILDGELVKTKGHSRLDYRDVVRYLNSKEENDFNLYIKVFDLIWLGEDLRSLPLEERRSKLEASFPGTQHVNIVRYTRSVGEDIINAVKMTSSREGAMIKDMTGTYNEAEKVYKLKHYLEVDVLVRKVTPVTNGYVYDCAFGSKESPVGIGSTLTTRVVAQEGDILRVRVRSIEKIDDVFVWTEPTALDKREDKENPDPQPVIDRISQRSVLDEDRTKWTTAFINSLPNGSFACVERAYTAGKTADKNCRHLPFKDKAGKVDLPHLRNAFARVNQIKPVYKGDGAESKETLVARAQSTLNKYRNLLNSGRFALYDAWEGKESFHVLLLPDMEKLKLPKVLSNSLLCRPFIQEIGVRSRLVDEGECQNIEANRFYLKGRSLNGEYVMTKVRIAGTDCCLLKQG